MRRTLLLVIILLPLNMLAQVAISGRVLNQAGKKAIAGASVFLSNATVGGVSSDDGSFKLKDVKPGKYDLVVSSVGFDTYAQVVIVGDRDIVLPDISLAAKTIILKEVTVKVKSDPNREVYLDMFKDEFLGTSELAKDCRILNPEVLDFDYDKQASKLSASSDDFLVIENDALGYRLKYLLKDFSVETKSPTEKKVFYKGPYLFEKLKGTPGQERRWERRRLEAYQNSPMHFLRALLRDRLAQEDFLVKKLVLIPNPARQSENTIKVKTGYYSSLQSRNAAQRDSLDYWMKQEKLPAKIEILAPDTLRKKDLLGEVSQQGLFDLKTDNSGLVVGYSKSLHFHLNTRFDYLYNPSNDETTLIRYSSYSVSFYPNGVLADPYSMINNGVWGRHRVAELLPIDYEPPMSPTAIAPNENISGKLKAYALANPVEKVYLHFNQPYYAAGDTLYFKAYVTAGERHVPSALSGVLHVDLINTKNKIDQSISLQLENSVAWGDFALPDSLPKGNYRVRAWTRWMRNDSAGFFERSIPIEAIKNVKVPESNAAKGSLTRLKHDIQFFPEGGTLVAGISSKIAFKAIGVDGLGLAVKGEVLDNNDKQVATYASTHLGMGSFVLNPEEGKTYRVRVDYIDGASAEVLLPVSLDKGITLSVNTDSLQKVRLRIEANKRYYAANKGKEFILLIYSGGVATTIDAVLDSTVVTIDLVKRRLFTGVNTVTLFAADGTPIAERLFFIQNHDQLNLSINTDKQNYRPRDKVDLKLIAKTRADSASLGHFSISVTDESKVVADENNEASILSDLLLTSDLKGNVEQPGYYFIADTAAISQKQRELDLVMLTNGYRRFTWKQVLNDTLKQPRYRPEQGLEIAGTVTNLSGKPISNAGVTLITRMGGPIVTVKSDDKGSFRFTGQVFSDTARMVLSAVNAKGNNTTKLIYKPGNSSPAVVNQFTPLADTSGLMAKYDANHKAQWNDYAQHGGPQGHLLHEVKIKAVKADDHYESSNLAGAGHADQVMHADEIEQIGGMLSTSLNGRLRGVMFNGPPGRQLSYLAGGQTVGPQIKNGMVVAPGNPMQIVLDGVEMPADFSVDFIRSGDVETVEVLRFASASIYGMNGGRGVLVITTKKGKGLQQKDIVAMGVLPITAKGFYVAREFYAPKYEVSDPANKRPDLRSTVYWKPELATDANGNGAIQFYNADGTGTYRVVVEGIDVNGNIGRLVYRYKVE